jgi:hypothetical protein
MAFPIVSYTVTGAGTSAVINVDPLKAPFNVGIGVDISATATYTVEYTFNDVSSDTFTAGSAVWFTDTSFGTATADKAISFTIPCRGVRLNVSASTGSATIYLQQAGSR